MRQCPPPSWLRHCWFEWTYDKVAQSLLSLFRANLPSKSCQLHLLPVFGVAIPSVICLYVMLFFCNILHRIVA